VNSNTTDTITKFCRRTPFIHNLKFYRSNMITGLVPRWYVFPSIIWHPRASNWSGRRPFSVPWQHNKCRTESIILLLRSGKWKQIPWLKILFFCWLKLYLTTFSVAEVLHHGPSCSVQYKNRGISCLYTLTQQDSMTCLLEKVPCLWRKYLISYSLQTSWTMQCWS